MLEEQIDSKKVEGIFAPLVGNSIIHPTISGMRGH